ncbi:hypothetical protein GOBAR_DD02937 [Gossypium barbadense]|nr:hypothetical protein GOBAR_DD02937 [Gossypium barbadense]
MLGVFSTEIVTPPEELVAAGDRSPSPRTTALALMKRYINSNPSSGMLDNLGSLRQQYGLAKCADEVMLVIEAYKALRDRAPYPPSHVVGHLAGNFAFLVFDKSTSTLFVASDQSGRVPLYWGITADGFVAFSDDAEMLKSACGKSIASFPQGCFFSTTLGEIRSYENPKNKIIAIPAPDEEIWGATFKVKKIKELGI